MHIPFFVLSICIAQELDPRAYTNIPKNANALGISYSFSTGAISTNATSPLKDFEVTIHTVAPGFVRTFGFFGRLARVQVVAPYSYMAGNLKFMGRDTSGTRNGLLDPRLRFGVNILGSPALTVQEFQKYKQGTIFGTSMVVSIPIGQYDKEKVINLGANRWAFKPEIGLSQYFKNLYLEFYSGVWFFTDNKSYLSTKTLSQSPLFSFQGHVIYTFKNQMWVGLNGNFANGGQGSIDGVKQDDYQRKWRVGGTISYPFSWQHSIKFQYHSGAYSNIGADYDIFLLAYQFIWL